jgi:hypothetical protein
MVIRVEFERLQRRGRPVLAARQAPPVEAANGKLTPGTPARADLFSHREAITRPVAHHIGFGGNACQTRGRCSRHGGVLAGGSAAAVWDIILLDEAAGAGAAG